MSTGVLKRWFILRLIENILNFSFGFQVRESDPDDPYGDRVVKLLDDFKISGINGTRNTNTKWFVCLFNN